MKIGKTIVERLKLKIIIQRLEESKDGNSSDTKESKKKQMTGGQPRWPTEMNTSTMMALPQWSLDVSDTLLHEGQYSSQHVSCIKGSYGIITMVIF
jgi:hypothetical protein